MRVTPCQACHGQRLKPTSLGVTVGDKNIFEVTSLSIDNLQKFMQNLELSEQQLLIGKQILKEIRARVSFLADVGLNYLTLARGTASLSGGEAQRIRLATQIGSGLVGVAYILDEPSIGLHQRDNDKLLATLKHLRDLGNSLIVVEHDEDTMRAADCVVDIGPGAGEHGGEAGGDRNGGRSDEKSEFHHRKILKRRAENSGSVRAQKADGLAEGSRSKRAQSEKYRREFPARCHDLRDRSLRIGKRVPLSMKFCTNGWQEI